MGATLDPTKAHATRRYGDLVAVLSWMNDKRALFLVPLMRTKAPWFVIPDEAFHEWRDTDRDNFAPNPNTGVPYLHERAATACYALGFEPSWMSVFRIISVVNDILGEAVTMPSAPQAELSKATFGQLKLRIDGKVVAGQEIRLPQAGPTYG